ncbi:MAG: NTP transferase domain-containing protein [Planctomycetota bacterium]
MLHRILDAWTRSRVDRVSIVYLETDEALCRIAHCFEIDVVRLPVSVPHMKDSFCAGLRYLEAHFSPEPDDVCLVAPADLPTLSPRVINSVLDVGVGSSPVSGRLGPVVPRYGTLRPSENAAREHVPVAQGFKKGHPVMLPWHMACEAHELGEDHGLNKIVERYVASTKWVDLDAGLKPTDIDTPEEYEELLKRSARIE